MARVDPLPANTPNTLAGVAAALSCVVYAWVQNPELGQPGVVHANLVDSPDMIKIGLFVDNYTAPDVVAQNLDIEIDGIHLNTGLTPTLKSVEEGFSPLNLEQADFVVKLENIPGIFASTALLTHADFIIPPPPPATNGAALPNFSIDNLPPGCGSIDFLATTNRLVQNFFYAGSAVYLRACCYQPQPFDTFASLAEQFNHITLDQLAQFNAVAPLNPDVALAIPDLTYLDSPASAYAPYSPTTIDSLTTIAGAFKTSALSIAQINQYLPGIFAEGVTIPVGNSFRPGPLDSLQSAADGLQLPFDQFVSAVASLPGFYRTNGVVITPLPNVPDAGSGKSPTLEDVAQKFNIQSPNETSVTPLLMANRSLDEFLLEGATIAGPAGSQPLTVKAHDTINTILARFQREQGLEVTVNQIISANALTPGLLTVNRPFLLPPSPTYISTAITPIIPPQGSVEEGAIIFPVSVSIETRRSQGLVAPDFKQAPAVFKNISSFAPRGIASGASSVSLKTFAQQFEEAFASYRLKCALVQKEALSATPEPAQLYAVNFGPTGVSRLLVDASAPQFYALAPLSTKLLTGTLPIRPYKSGCGFGEIVYKQFDSV
ncbi:MAG: LysM peptidoglycan-binding domain-containing protein, partial [Pyrinomonadaceae bacterium]